MYLVVLGCTRLLHRKYLVVLESTWEYKDVLGSTRLY